MDDCFLFTSAKTSQDLLVSQVLDSFCKASGLKINLHKSRFIVFSNVPRRKISKYTSILGFQYMNKIDKYLGFPILTRRAKIYDFCFVVDRINSKLVGWKAKLLNRPMRVTLAKAVLDTIPIYTMQNVWILEGVCNNIDNIVRRFMWGKSTSHWVN